MTTRSRYDYLARALKVRCWNSDEGSGLLASPKTVFASSTCSKRFAMFGNGLSQALSHKSGRFNKLSRHSQPAKEDTKKMVIVPLLKITVTTSYYNSNWSWMNHVESLIYGYYGKTTGPATMMLNEILFDVMMSCEWVLPQIFGGWTRGVCGIDWCSFRTGWCHLLRGKHATVFGSMWLGHKTSLQYLGCSNCTWIGLEMKTESGYITCGMIQ